MLVRRLTSLETMVTASLLFAGLGKKTVGKLLIARG